MHRAGIMFVFLLLAGCATRRTAVVAPANPPPEKLVVREASATRVVETRYELRSYCDADDPAVRHDAHAVYRATRVPAHVTTLETVPRDKFAPVSYAPLPPSAELSAELAAQKQITASLHAIQANMAAVEQQAQNQYGALVTQTAETLKLRRQLEEERTRALAAKRPEADATPPAATGEPKW